MSVSLQDPATIFTPYKPPLWLPGGDLQTIFASQFARKPAVNYRRERWSTPDADFVDIDFVDGAPGAPLLVLFHGLEGSSHSHYARSLMAHVASLGWAGAIPHFRSCSGELNHAPRFYHCGDFEEIDWILRRLKAHAAHASAPLFVVGASLGGSVLLHWLARASAPGEVATAACAVSAPLDLAAGGRALATGFNRLYTRVFLRSLVPKCLQKLDQHPGLYDREALLNCRTLYEFDNIVTAPLHGFQSTDDYWERASPLQYLQDITVPTLVLNARNDPFLPAGYLPTVAPPAVTLHFPDEGGHLGFPESGAGSLTWLPKTLTSYLAAHLPRPLNGKNWSV